MKYTRDYSGMEPDEAYLAAIDDIKSYLGDQHFKKVLMTFGAHPDADDVYNVRRSYVRKEIRRQIRVGCDLFLGIRGYPVAALERFILRSNLQRLRGA